MTERRRSSFLPREHGFWVMLTAVVASALARSTLAPQVFLVALATVAVAVCIASLTRNLVRKKKGAQLASAALLSLVGIPVALTGGESWRSASTMAVAWAAIFVASALVVRGTFARARLAKRRVVWLDGAAVSLIFAAFIGFLVSNLPELTWATGTSLVAIGALVALRPTVKQLKPVGLALGGIATLAAVAMSW